MPSSDNAVAYDYNNWRDDYYMDYDYDLEYDVEHDFLGSYIDSKDSARKLVKNFSRSDIIYFINNNYEIIYANYSVALKIFRCVLYYFNVNIHEEDDQQEFSDEIYNTVFVKTDSANHTKESRLLKFVDHGLYPVVMGLLVLLLDKMIHATKNGKEYIDVLFLSDTSLSENILRGLCRNGAWNTAMTCLLLAKRN